MEQTNTSTFPWRTVFSEFTTKGHSSFTFKHPTIVSPFTYPLTIHQEASSTHTPQINDGRRVRELSVTKRGPYHAILPHKSPHKTVCFAQQLLAYRLSLSGTGSVITQMIRHLEVVVVKTPHSDFGLRHFFQPCVGPRMRIFAYRTYYFARGWASFKLDKLGVPYVQISSWGQRSCQKLGVAQLIGRLSSSEQYIKHKLLFS